MKNWIKPIVCVLAACLLPYWAFVALEEYSIYASDVSPEGLLKTFDQKGQRAMDDMLGDDYYKWEKAHRGIAAGSADWLGVANQLALSSGAHTLEETYAALSVLLDESPGKVFELANVEAEIVCSFFDDAHGQRTIDLRKLYVQRLEKLRSLEGGRYAQKAVECREHAKFLLEHAEGLERH
jgi:hypothetical protein